MLTDEGNMIPRIPTRTSTWRACELTVGGHSIILDVTPKQRSETYSVTFSDCDQTKIINSPQELLTAIHGASLQPYDFAKVSDRSFAFIVCILGGKPYSTLGPNAFIWREIEERFGKRHKDIYIDSDCIRFKMISSYCPVLRVHEGLVKLNDLSLTDSVILEHAPWPEER